MQMEVIRYRLADRWPAALLLFKPRCGSSCGRVFSTRTPHGRQQCGSSCLGKATFEVKGFPKRQYSVESIRSPETWCYNACVLRLLHLLPTVRYVIQTFTIVVELLHQSVRELFVWQLLEVLMVQHTSITYVLLATTIAVWLVIVAIVVETKTHGQKLPSFLLHIDTGA
jgi:hypothetical protein